MRYLLTNHPIAVCVVLFGVVMVAIRYAIVPYVIGTFGHAGFIAWVAVFIGLAFLLDRRDAH